MPVSGTTLDILHVERRAADHSADIGSNYTRDLGGEAEIYFYKPPHHVAPRRPGDDPHEMTVHDGWDRAAAFSPDREGFAMREFRSSFQEWDDDDAIRQRFYGEAAEFVRREVGAKRLVIFDHTIRAKRNERQQTDEHTTSQRAPVMLVHCDYTPNSGPLRVRQLLPIEADTLLKRRVAFYNFWKPLRGMVAERPLEMCDATSSSDQDFITMRLRYRDRDGEIFVLRYSPQHHWWYFPQMNEHRAILLKTYDSETDGRARFVGHSAFDDPATPPDAPMRESIEISRPRGDHFKIVRLLPETDNVLQYRVKSQADGHERVVREDQLDRAS